jgi:signal transduction histidine kinase
MNTLITERKADVAPGGDASAGNRRARMSERSAIAVAFGAFTVLLGLSVLGFVAVQSANDRQAGAAFESRKQEVVKSLEDRLATYTQVLRGGLGLFAASTAVDRGEWKAYVDALELNKRYPGIQGVGYAEFVKPSDMPAYLETVCADGFPNFTVRPEGERPLYSSITYLEPFDARNIQAFGYDMYSQVTRRTAMDRARDSGDVAISGKLTLVQEITTNVQAGFLIYLPFYGEGQSPNTVLERRALIKGFVYSPFRMGDLMAGVLGESLHDVDLRIYDGEAVGAEALMYALTPGKEATQAEYASDIPFQFGGHIWTLRVSSQSSFAEAHSLADPLIVLMVCLIISFLVFSILMAFAMTRRRAQQIAKEKTQSLEERTEELARSNQELERFAYAASHDLRSPLRAISSLTGWLEDDLQPVLTDDSREHLALMKNRVGRMEALLTGLLQYSRIGRGDDNVHMVNGCALAVDVLDIVEVPPEFTIDISPDLPDFYGDKAPVTHVLQNLVDNAIKHHDRPDGKIWITGADLGDKVSFTVTDDGPGIPEEFHERVFGMFQTLHRRDEVEGSGLGLAMVKRYVERNGGDITLDSSNSARGAAFQFTWVKAETKGAALTAPRSEQQLQEAA